MARDYIVEDFTSQLVVRRHNVTVLGLSICLAAALLCLTPISARLTPAGYAILIGIIPSAFLFVVAMVVANHLWIERERRRESERRGGKPVLGMPPNRQAFEGAINLARKNGKSMIDRYLCGFEVDSGAPIWVTDDELCSHAAVFAKTGVGKTLWLEGLMCQQMARGRASGLTFIDAKRDPATLADIILMAAITGRIEDVIVVDPFDPVCSYNFVFTTQRADVKARKVLRCGLPPTSDQSTTKHYDRLAADAVYRVVRAMESLGLAWSVRDIAVALSAFTVAYPRIRELLHEQDAKQAMVELGHLASSYRTAKGSLDSARLTDNLRGIASELHSIANSEAGEMFCVPRADLSLTDAILRGKIIYFMLPRLEEAESAARMVKVFREDLEVSIGEITSSRMHHLEDPHMVIIDEGASTFGPTWANLFELARKGRFALLFGAQSIGGLMDQSMGLSREFYERVMANVNLKVIMRIGDNRTAEDMSEWIGKINTEKTTIATGISSSTSSHELTKRIEINKRAADGYRDGYTVSEDETELVSAEELKHEMSAEKGLAWFDKGDGRLRKGRSIWFDNSAIPVTWEGREFLTRYESVEADEIGLAEWVDEHILSTERAEHQRGVNHTNSVEQQQANAAEANAANNKSSSSGEGNGGAAAAEPEQAGGFRLNPLKGFRGMGRARVTVTEAPPPEPEPAPEAKKKAEPQETQASKPAEENKKTVQADSEKKQAADAAKPSAKPMGRPAVKTKPAPASQAKPKPTPAARTNPGPAAKPTPAAQAKSAEQKPKEPRQDVDKDSASKGDSGAEKTNNESEKSVSADDAGQTSGKKKRRRRRRKKSSKSSGELEKSKQGDKLVLRGNGRDTITTSVEPPKTLQ